MAIVGKPNVGKSTLLNALLGVKVVPISSKPQTTRKRVRGIHTEKDRQLVFVDTPGLHQPEDALGQYMVHQVSQALAEVNLVLWVVDLRKPPGPEDELVARALKPLPKDVPVILVGNKVDAAKAPELAMRHYQELLSGRDFESRVISSFSESDVASLREELLAFAPEGPFFFPQDFARSDQTPEEWASEIVREEALKRLREEVPYAIAVKVDEFEERDNGMIYIHAFLYVERAAHKPIVIGKGGRMLREIGQAARKQLEIFLSHKVFLDLEVKVYPNWRKDPEALRELGYL